MFPVSEFLIYCFVTSYAPGANNLVSMSYAARLGFRRSVCFNWGITVGFLMVMTVCAVLSSILYALLSRLKVVIQILGAAYMLYMAWTIRRNILSREDERGKTASFLSGMVLQFMNPMIGICAITAMSLYILPIYDSAPALAAFVLVLTGIGASGCFVWALCGSVLRRFIAKHTKEVNMVMALLLVYCAVSLFL